VAISDWYYVQGLKYGSELEHKSHPAPVAAERIRQVVSERKAIEAKLRVAQYIIRYYQSLFPFLEDLLGDIDDGVLTSILSRRIEEPIRNLDESGVDPVRIYLPHLSDSEYGNLSTSQRNQLALDRYMTRAKSTWDVGREYERFVGFAHEQSGYAVYYQGIIEGYDDLGRDLIATNPSHTLVIQCKRWSSQKTIRENHVNQLFGTTVKYKMDHPGEKVMGVLYTTTSLSQRAKEFANYLEIHVHESYRLQQYPLIKCNVSRRSGEKIYHLPFDQQYDRVLVEEERNERYVATVAEAEAAGFRRAWKWLGHQ
jgi:hypothetical protein